MTKSGILHATKKNPRYFWGSLFSIALSAWPSVLLRFWPNDLVARYKVLNLPLPFTLFKSRQLPVKRARHSFEKLPVLHSSLAVPFLQQSAGEKLICPWESSKLESHWQIKCHGEKKYTICTLTRTLNLASGKLDSWLELLEVTKKGSSQICLALLALTPTPSINPICL